MMMGGMSERQNRQIKVIGKFARETQPHRQVAVYSNRRHRGLRMS
jgi:hypothetical protein